MSETPENIYRRVLEIGSECLTCGISFNQLKERLTDEGYDLENDCLERCLREWFLIHFFTRKWFVLTAQVLYII